MGRDYPAATKRLIQRAEGVHYTIVNGKVIYDDGKLSGEMAGTVLRSAAHQAIMCKPFNDKEELRRERTIRQAQPSST